MSGCCHQYDDDGPFLPDDVAALVAPGSKPGDLCVWCLEPKPEPRCGEPGYTHCPDCGVDKYTRHLMSCPQLGSTAPASPPR